MKSVLEFVKQRWLVVVIVLAGIVVLPVGLIFANKMQDSAHAAFQDKVTKAAQPLRSTKMTYKFTPVDPTGQAKSVELSHEPNEAVTAYFQGKLVEQQKSSESIVKDAELRNKELAGKPRQPLVPGFFTSDARLQVAGRLDFARRASREELSKGLLDRVRAGLPPDAGKLAADLRFDRQALLRQALGVLTDPSQLPPGRLAAIEEAVREKRLKEYAKFAQGVDVFADASILPFETFSPTLTPTVLQCWDLQQRYWIVSDVLSAVALANATAENRATAAANGVPRSVVKRILSISVAPDPLLAGDGSSGGGVPGGGMGAGAGAGGTPEAAPAMPGLVPGPGGLLLSPQKSITGRVSGPGSANTLFDVREARLVAIVSTERLPELFDALAKVNFITVLNIGVERVDTLEELRAGFDYGADHVSKVTIDLETVWMRSWTEPLMPVELKEKLGIVPAAAPQS